MLDGRGGDLLSWLDTHGMRGEGVLGGCYRVAGARFFSAPISHSTSPATDERVAAESRRRTRARERGGVGDGSALCKGASERPAHE